MDPQQVESIEGVITLEDGTVSRFLISAGAGQRWRQWGATMGRLGQSVDAVVAMADALTTEELMAGEER